MEFDIALRNAIKNLDVNAVRHLMAQHRRPVEHASYLRGYYLHSVWWKQVEDALQLDDTVTNEHTLYEAMDRAHPSDAKTASIAELDRIEDTLLKIVRILKHHEYLLPSPLAHTIIDFLNTNDYRVAEALIGCYRPDRCDGIYFDFASLDRNLKEPYNTRYNKVEQERVVEAFVKHCASCLEKTCTLHDVLYFPYALGPKGKHKHASPFLQQCIHKYFPNPALYAEREPYLSLAEAIDDHDQGVQSTHVRDPSSKHLTDFFMKRDIAGYIGDYSVEHSPPSLKAKRQRQQTSSPDSIAKKKPMAGRGGCGYSKKQKRKVGGKRSRQKKRPRRFTRKLPPAQGQGQVLEQGQNQGQIQGPGFVDNVKTGVGYGIGLTVGEGIANAAGNAFFGSNDE